MATKDEPGWLVKDFDVLYRGARELVEGVSSDRFDERNVFSRDTLIALHTLRAQLERLAPAFDQIQRWKASSGPTVANPMTLADFASAAQHLSYRRPADACPERLGQDDTFQHLRPQLGSVEDHIGQLRADLVIESPEDRATGKGD